MAEQQESGPAHEGFVECLFELFKVRSKIIRARLKFQPRGNFWITPTDLVTLFTKNNALSTQVISPDLFWTRAKV